MLSPNGTAAGKVGHPFDKLRTGVRLLANNKALLVRALLFMAFGVDPLEVLTASRKGEGFCFMGSTMTCLIAVTISHELKTCKYLELRASSFEGISVLRYNRAP